MRGGSEKSDRARREQLLLLEGAAQRHVPGTHYQEEDDIDTTTLLVRVAPAQPMRDVRLLRGAASRGCNWGLR